MKRIINYITVLCTLLALSVSCKTVFSEEEMPQQYVPLGEVIMDDEYLSLEFSGNADSHELTFSVNYDWKILTTQSWVTFSENMGSAGDHTITIYVDKSYEDIARESQLTFVVERLRESFTISQAKGNVMTPSQRSYSDLKLAAQTLDVEVTYNSEFDIEYDFGGDDDWISSTDQITHLDAPSESTIITLTFDILENETYNERTATIAFVNESLDVREEFTVSQFGSIPVVLGDYENFTVGAAAITEPEEVVLTAAINFELESSEEWLVPGDGVFDEVEQTFTFNYTTLSHDDKTTTRTAYIYLINDTEDVVRTITVTQDEYNDDAYITVTAADQMTDKITELLAANTSIAKADYNRLYVTGKGVALSSTDLSAIKSNLTGLKLVDISNTATTEIPSALYSANSTLQQFIFPSTLESIGDTAFQNSGLTSVTIPGDSGNVAIGYRSFFNCASLASVTLERGVVELGAQSFSTLISLTYLFVPKTITTWATGTDGTNKAFYGCTSLKTATLEEGLTSIACQTFSQCGLTEIYIPGSVDFSLNVNSAGDNKAFGSCTSLSKIEFGDGMKSISCNPLNSCTMVATVIMPEDVPSGTSLGSSVGTNVTGGLKMYVPDGSYDEYKSSSWNSTYSIYSLVDYVE